MKSVKKKGKILTEKTKNKNKGSACGTLKVKNINIIYCPYFPTPVQPQICIYRRSPFVFAGKHNLILE